MKNNVTAGILLLLLGAAIIAFFATAKGRQVLAVLGAKSPSVPTTPATGGGGDFGGTGAGRKF